MSKYNAELTEFYSACQVILHNKDAKALNWAVQYARHGKYHVHTLREAKVQSAYILSNIKYWRGDVAAHVRKIFKHYATMKGV